MRYSLIIVPLAIALLVWIVRTKRYAEALLITISLGSAYSCVMGASAIRNDSPWFGAAMIAMGLAAMIGVAIIVIRLRSNVAKTVA
jgi:cyanate permease